MTNLLKLKSTLGRSHNVDPGDTLRLKAMLRGLGYYKAPEHGLTVYPDPQMFEALEAFQADAGLKRDGVAKPDGPTVKVLAQSLQGLGRNGDTILAHLTPEEARLLDQVTDGGSVNPKTGLLEFWNGDNESQESYDAGAASDAQAAENNAQGNANRSAERGDPAGYGDLTSVNAVNQARARAQDQAREREQARARQAAEQARRDEAAKKAREREQRARMQDLAERTERARRASVAKQKTRRTANLLDASDSDAQFGNYDAGAASDDQATENAVQKSARPSKADSAGYGDMTSVNAVNKARQIRVAARISKKKDENVPNPYAGDIAAMNRQMQRRKLRQDEQVKNFNTVNPQQPKNEDDIIDGLNKAIVEIIDKVYKNATAWHYEDRTALNKPLPSDEATAIKDGFKHAPDPRDTFHQNNTGKREKKYVHPDGREIVFDGDTGEVVTDSRYVGTYNYHNDSPIPDIVSPEQVLDYLINGAIHGVLDIVPYVAGGNKRSKN